MEIPNSLKQLSLIILLLLLSSKSVFAVQQKYYIDSENSWVEFHAASTLHDFEGKTNQIEASISFDPATGILEVPQVVIIPIQSLKTGIGARDKAMQKMFDVEHSPDLIGKVTELNCPSLQPDVEVFCEGMMDLTIKDKLKRIPLKIEVGLRPIMETKGSFLLSLKEFELKPPSVFRVIKVSDQIKVNFSIVWKKEKEVEA